MLRKSKAKQERERGRELQLLCNCHMRVSLLLSHLLHVDLPGLTVCCFLANSLRRPQNQAKVFGHTKEKTQLENFSCLRFAFLRSDAADRKLSITPQCSLCLFMNFADSCCLDNNFKSYTTWRMCDGQGESCRCTEDSLEIL